MKRKQEKEESKNTANVWLGGFDGPTKMNCMVDI